MIITAGKNSKGKEKLSNSSSSTFKRSIHWPALDGLRGIAIISVVAFHAGILPGGFFGVEIFFVLSGFLITSLLCDQFDRAETFSLRKFWSHRAQRLLPPLCFALFGIGVYALYINDMREFQQLAGDLRSTIFYAANWHFVFGGQGYWDTFTAPSPMRHMWSLAIEEQFYILWPFLVWGLYSCTRKVFWVMVVAGIGFFVSVLQAAVHASTWSIDRVYLGTDTRVSALCVGAFFAGYVGYKKQQTVEKVVTDNSTGISSRRFLSLRGSPNTLIYEVVGYIALASLVVAFFVWGNHAPSLFYGKFIAIQIATLILIGLALSKHQTVSNRILEWKVLQWFGRVSYGLYLWHWIVLVFVDRNAHGVLQSVSEPGLVAIKIAGTVGLTGCSFFLVEEPFRKHRMGKKWSLLTKIGMFVMLGSAVLFSLYSVGYLFGKDKSLPQIQTQQEVTNFINTSNLGSYGWVAEKFPQRTSSQEKLFRVVLFGDSVATSFAQQLVDQAGERSIEIISVTEIGCALGKDAPRWLDGNGNPQVDEDRCQFWHEMWDDIIAWTQPDVVLFAFGGSRGRTEFNGTFVGPCDASWFDWYGQQIRWATQLGREHDASVLWVPPVYVRPYGRYPEEQVDKDVSCMSNTMREVIREINVVGRSDSTNSESTFLAQVLDFDLWLCPTRKSCTWEIDGTELRPDGFHFSPEGASFVAQWFLAEIEKYRQF